jgi:hypothetical protein
VPRDDWESYGGEPGLCPSSEQKIKFVLEGILGASLWGKMRVRYILGREEGILRLVPFRTGIISWISSISADSKFPFWSTSNRDLECGIEPIKTLEEKDLAGLLRGYTNFAKGGN